MNTISTSITECGPVLVVAAHPDDEVLGCGGTIARWSLEGRAVHILIIADGESSRDTDDPSPVRQRNITARNSSALAASRLLTCKTVEILGLPDNRLDGVQLLDIVKQVETYVLRYQPSTILTHHSGDVNIDHRVVHEAVIAACRPVPDHPVTELLFFEVPSSTEWRPPTSAEPFIPNYFVDISATLPTKLAAAQLYSNEMRAYPHPRSIKGLEALAHWRGVTIGVDAAEAFILGRKILPNKARI